MENAITFRASLLLAAISCVIFSSHSIADGNNNKAAYTKSSTLKEMSCSPTDDGTGNVDIIINVENLDRDAQYVNTYSTELPMSSIGQVLRPIRCTSTQ